MRNLKRARELRGWEKIEQTCRLARRQDPPLKWAWIDTCCIDKRSSAELTEAINSMFRWYQEATICFAYLSDLPPSPTREAESRESQEHMSDHFKHCRWLRRGWTLQELVASKVIDFFDSTWTKRGTKASLARLIASTTGIDMSVLRDSDQLSTIPVGRRMSWAANRETTRVEDMAYCLFGIFDVNMPLIYGEGKKAFIRLQSVIAQQTNDLSLFAWDTRRRTNSNDTAVQRFHGMFAESPRDFASCKNIVRLEDPYINECHSFTITNRGKPI